MIPILYDKGEGAFASNGLCRLRDCISCVVTEERNGIYECDFEYPVDGAHYDMIQCGRIVAVTHDESGVVQPFDIVGYERPINGVVTFHAVHISYRQTALTVSGTNINSLADAFTMLGTAKPNNPFNYWTDKGSTGYLGAADGVPHSVRSVLGGMEGSILDAYGGEYEWDKWTVKLWSARGSLKNFTIRYGVNMTDYSEDTDYSDTYNSVIPYWVGQDNNGDPLIITGDRQESGYPSFNGTDRCIPLDVTERFNSEDGIPTKAQVEAEGRSYITANSPYLPAQTLKVDFMRISDSPEYAQFESLQRCKLCDTIKVLFPQYNVEGTFKIVKTEYDVLNDRYLTLELGTLSISLATALGINSSGSYYVSVGGGGGGTTNYNDLENKPSINGTTLSGNKTSANLSIHEVPSGGSTGQVLSKASGTDYDLEWSNGSGVADVKVNGTSVVVGGVADVPVAKESSYGVVKGYYNSDPPGGVMGITYHNSLGNELTAYAPLTIYNNGAYQPIRAKFLPDATQSIKGAMSASDKTKLDGIASGAEVNVQSNWTEADSSSDAFILNKPSLAAVATSGSYNDLLNKPTIPTVNDATLTIKKNGTTVATFTANAGTDKEADIAVPATTSDLFNDSGFITSSDLPQEYDFTTTLTPSIDSRGVTSKVFTITPTDASRLTTDNCKKLSAYLTFSVGGGDTAVYPLIVVYFTISSSVMRIYVKSIYGNPQSTTSSSVSGTLHIVAPFEISNVTAYTPM